MLHFLANVSDAEITAFENEEFRDWLTAIDARIDYDVRKQIALTEWRHLFDFGYAANEATMLALGIR